MCARHNGSRLRFPSTKLDRDATKTMELANVATTTYLLLSHQKIKNPHMLLNLV